MFNRKIEITEDNESILFVNAVIENLRYGIISLDMMQRYEIGKCYNDYYDEHTFYFFHMQSVLAAQGNIYNVLFNDFYDHKQVSRERVRKVRDEPLKGKRIAAAIHQILPSEGVAKRMDRSPQHASGCVIPHNRKP